MGNEFDGYEETRANKDELAVLSLCEMIYGTYRTKNHDYGNSVEKGFNKHGAISLLIRLEDKMNRLDSLLNKTPEEQRVKSESIEDTLIDLAGYAIIGAMLLKKEKARKLAEAPCGPSQQVGGAQVKP